MGALVYLYNRYDQVVRQSLTNENGQFVFDALPPDLYSVRVALSSFVPALKRGIAVQAGIESVLNVNLASVLSTIELVRAAPGQTLMSDEWKWALRSAAATRPVMRLLPGIDIGTRAPANSSSIPIFTETRGLFHVAAGDAVDLGGVGAGADLGTAFAVATSLYGANKLNFSGNFGVMPHSGLPAIGFSTTYRRESSNGWLSPELTLSARQLFMPDRTGSANMPVLRTMSMSSIDRLDLTSNARLEYGVSVDAIQFTDRLNYVSPFARLTYALGAIGAVQFGFSSGAPPLGLFNNRDATGEHDPDLMRDLALLSTLPRLSIEGGHTRMQRATNFEVGYRKALGKTTLRASVYREQISNAALQVSAPYDLFVGEVLPDLSSNASVFDGGSLTRTGGMASLSRQFGDRFEGALSLGRGGVLTPIDRQLSVDTDSALRSDLKTGERTWASAKVKATLPMIGTQLTSSYTWTDYTAMMPGHVFLTQDAFPETGMNLGIRQPMPNVFGMPGRLELSIDARNMLAQGYLPLRSATGRQFLLIQAPRALRGGLSFIF
jgi:hypothetical protein